jgi:hypothetical protein
MIWGQPTPREAYLVRAKGLDHLGVLAAAHADDLARRPHDVAQHLDHHAPDTPARAVDKHAVAGLGPALDHHAVGGKRGEQR